MLLRVTIPVDKGNIAIKDGSMPTLMETFIQRYKPENAYFTTIDGQRTALLFLNVTEPSQMPAIAEPFFTQLNAKVEFHPAMNADDLKKGLEALMGAAAAGAR